MGKPVHRMVREYLKSCGFDGLMQEDGECGCDLVDLMPCEDPSATRCCAGYKTPCPEDCGEHDWHIRAAPTLCDACEAGVKRHNCMGSPCPNAETADPDV